MNSLANFQIRSFQILVLIAFTQCFVSCSKDLNQVKSTSTLDSLPKNSISVLTQHNDNTRAGWNNHETFLTVNNVNTNKFGKQFVLGVDDQVYAQPLSLIHI